jgi:hypothetical protein
VLLADAPDGAHTPSVLHAGMSRGRPAWGARMPIDERDKESHMCMLIWGLVAWLLGELFGIRLSF